MYRFLIIPVLTLSLFAVFSGGLAASQIDMHESVFEMDETTNMTDEFGSDVSSVLKHWEIFNEAPVQVANDPADLSNKVVKISAEQGRMSPSGLIYSCLNPTPVSEEVYYAKARMYRPSAGYVSGKNFNANFVTIFSVLGIGTAKNISIRFMDMDKNNPNIGMYALYVHQPNGTDEIKNVFFDPVTVGGNLSTAVMNQKFNFNEWVTFEVIYNHKTGSFRLIKNGMEMFPATMSGGTATQVEDSVSVKGEFTFSFKYAFGMQLNRKKAVADLLVDDYTGSFSRACRGEVPPDVENITPVASNREPYSITVGSSVEADSGFLDMFIAPPPVKIMDTPYTPRLRYYTFSANPTVSIATLTKNGSPFGTKAKSSTWELRTPGVNDKYYLQPSNDEKRQAYMWEAMDSGGNSLGTGAYLYNMRVSTDYPDQDLRLVTPVAGYNVIVNLQQSPFGSGWYLEEEEGLMFPPDESMIINYTQTGNAQAYTEGGYVSDALMEHFRPQADSNKDVLNMIYHPSGYIYSAGAEDGAIYKFNALSANQDPDNAAGVHIVRSDAGVVAGPHDMAVDSSGKVYAASTIDDAIYVSSGGGFSRLMVQGLKNMLSDPYGLAADGDTLYVSNRNGNSIVKISDIGGSAAKAEFIIMDIKEPAALELTQYGLFVLHKNLKGQATLSKITGSGSSYNLHTAAVFTDENAKIEAMTADGNGDLYVTDSENGKVWHIVMPDEVVLCYSNEIEHPAGIASGPGDIIYVADADTGIVFPLFPDRVFYPGRGSYSRITFMPEDNTYVKRYIQGAKVVFDETGTMTTRIDAVGNTYSYEHTFLSGKNLLTKITLPFNKQWSFNYANGSLSSIVDPTGRETRFEINPENLLEEVTYPDNSEVRYGYTADTKLINSRTDEEGFTTKYNYGDYSRISSVENPNGQTHNFDPNEKKNLLKKFRPGTPEEPAPQSDPEPSSYENPNGNGYSFETNEFGQITKATGPRGETSVVERDSESNRLGITRPDGVGVKMKYDEYGNLLSYENPAAGISYSYEYEHKFYRPVKYTDPRGNVKTWTYYEDTPLVKEITDALGRKQTMLEYTPQGQPKKVQGADGSINEIIYDETTGNMIGSKDPLLRTESSTLDDAGNVLSTTDKLGRTIQRFTYDVMGRQTRAVDANGYFVNYYYDKRGLLTETIDSENRGTDTILESK